MKNRRNYYRLLHVQPEAPLEVIKASYRSLMTKLKGHPDLGGDHDAAVLINEAYAALTNPDKRREYDQTLKQRRPAPPPDSAPRRTRRQSATSGAHPLSVLSERRDDRAAVPAVLESLDAAHDPACHPTAGAPGTPVNAEDYQSRGAPPLPELAPCRPPGAAP